MFGMIRRIVAIIAAVTCAGLIVTFVPRLSTIGEAFAKARAVSTDNSAVNQPQAQYSCDDFEFWFLNPSCSKVRAKHAARTKHRVATFLSGHAAGAQIASP